MRPDSIRKFVWCFLVGAIAPIVAILIDYHLLQERAIKAGQSALGPMLGLLFSAAVDLVLWILIVRKASNVGKWIFVIVNLLTVVSLPIQFAELVAVGALYTGLMLVSFVAWAVGCVLLFRKDARQWLASGGKVLPVDPEVFS